MQRTTGRGVGEAFGEGRAAQNSNGQLFTDGRVVYSYGKHWPLAAWIDGQLHLNEDKYSVTTSKHKSFVVRGVYRAGMARALDTAVRHATTRDMIAAISA